MPYSLTARCSLLERIDLGNLLDWYSRETVQITTESFRHVAQYVAAERLNVTLDSRPNGPARASFEFAGGEPPERVGSTNDWTAHHLYSGKFPYLGRPITTHAVKLGNHFTQSAGVITAHPIADALCDEYPFFAWLLRALSYQKFGYDGVFSNKRNEFGFEAGRSCMVFLKVPKTGAAG